MGGLWPRPSTHTAFLYQGNDAVMESRWWMSARQLTRCHQKQTTQAGRTDDPSLWGDGWWAEVNMSTAIATHFAKILQKSIMTKHSSRKNMNSQNKWSVQEGQSPGRDSHVPPVAPHHHQTSGCKMKLKYSTSKCKFRQHQTRNEKDEN